VVHGSARPTRSHTWRTWHTWHTWHTDTAPSWQTWQTWHVARIVVVHNVAYVADVTRGARGRRWQVLHTDELADPRSAQRLMDETFAFLGLPAVPIGNETRMCVHGKAGVMDVLNAFEGSVRIGTKDVAPELLNVGTCDKPPKGMHREPRYGALHHDIEPALLRRLRAYYEPSNQRLYRFLGTDLGW
jgi:hypothetical protein